MVKNPPVMWETCVRPLGWEHPLEESMGTHSSLLAGEPTWTEEPDGHSPCFHKEWDMTEWLRTSLILVIAISWNLMWCSNKAEAGAGSSGRGSWGSQWQPLVCLQEVPTFQVSASLESPWSGAPRIHRWLLWPCTGHTGSLSISFPIINMQN